MKNRLLYAPEGVPALKYAVEELEDRGVSIASEPTDRVTHLLLPVPCKMDGQALASLLASLPRDVTVVGGMLNNAQLQGYRCIDLLEDPLYLAKNAMITAHCALRLAEGNLSVIWEGCPVLVLGWGRIGKCLSSILKKLGAEVSIAARKSEDLAMIAALGCDGRSIAGLDCILRRYRVIFNTIPAPVLMSRQIQLCRKDCLLIELASSPGIEGASVIDGRGLPGKMAPESSGKLIARSVMRLCVREEETE